MFVVSIRAFQYRIPIRPIRVLGKTLEQRKGILLQSSEQPNVWAEAAPLPYYSPESFEDAYTCLKQNLWRDSPSLRFAISMLTMDEFPSGSVHVNALLSGYSNEVLQTSSALSALPYRAVKLKIGIQDLVSEIELVRAVRHNLHQNQALRLDANRSWELSQAIEFGQAISDIAIDYIEEPTSQPKDAEEFFQQTGVPYALDETLHTHPDLEPYPQVKALVVKPSCIGGLDEISRLADSGIPLVFSSVYESGVGLFHIARLARKFSPTVPVGLDTYHWMDEDVLTNRWDISNGLFEFAGPLQIDTHKLQPIRL